MKLIVGLGNPGEDYANHKHNVGFWAVEALAEKFQLAWEKPSRWAFEAWGKIEGEDCWLAKPLIWMNKSGEALRFLLEERKTAPADLLLLHDDMDVRLGEMRWVFGAGFGGHNGVRSVQEILETKDFFRLRLGVGRPPAHADPADYVLQPFTGKDLSAAEELTRRGAESVAGFLKHGLEWAQNHYHAAGKKSVKREA